MPYTPSGTFCTPHMLRLLLSACPTVQEVLGVATEEDALAKILTYSEDPGDSDPDSDEPAAAPITYPRCLIKDSEIELDTSEEGGLLDVASRMLEVWIGFYVPVHDDISTVTDEHAWCLEKFSDINGEMLAQQSRGEPIAGQTHLSVHNPIFYGVQREPDDERGDPRVDTQPDRPRWFGLLTYEVH